MDAAFAEIKFNEPGAAEANLAILESRLSPKLWNALPALLAQLPNPDDALNFLERYLRDAPSPQASSKVARHLDAHPAALHYLLSLFSYSRFLSESLIQQPELILWLDRRGANEGIERRKSREDLLEDCYRFSAMAFDLAPALVLARFKRREYLRITLRDVLGIASLAETTLELSDLADTIIERALRLCAQALENQHGLPQWRDANGQLQTARLTVISLGKLGGQELNYSSDIDLIFLYDHEGETAGASGSHTQAAAEISQKQILRFWESGGLHRSPDTGPRFARNDNVREAHGAVSETKSRSGGEELPERAGSISNVEYFVRLAQAMLKMLTEATPEGAVFRVDLRLRPEGQQGEIATSLAAALDYYRTRAREWELQMLIKARVSAGEVVTGRQFLREVHPLIFRPDFHLAAVEAIREAREGISRSLRQAVSAHDGFAAEWNVKLSPGGIRDIEFLAQCLQRVHGGRDPWLAGRRAASTLVALQRLHDKGHLTQREFFHLSDAYQFLRKVEHRLQLRDGLQEHTLPRKQGAIGRLARRCGIEASAAHSAGDELLRQTREHFARVREIYESVLPAESIAEPRPSESVAGNVSGNAPASGWKGDALFSRLRHTWLAVAERLEHHRAQPDAFARRGLEAFLNAAESNAPLMDALEAHPDWLDRAAEIFSVSDLIAGQLAREPEQIRLLAELFAGEVPAAASMRLPFTPTMDSLRVAYREAMLRAAIDSARGARSPFETFAACTAAAEKAIRGALVVDEMRRETGREMGSGMAREIAPEMFANVKYGGALGSAQFAVIALGRLGSGEFDAGSDADLIFVCGASIEQPEFQMWRRLAEQFIHAAGSYTSEGLLLPIDTRLRPRGGEGEIVQSAKSLLDYFANEAQAWEAATYLKARPVAGNCTFGESVLAELREVLRRRFCAEDCGSPRRERRGEEAGDNSRETTREVAGAQEVVPEDVREASHDPSKERRRELATELKHMRERLERERVEGPGGFKCAPGGFFDIEYVIAFLALSRGVFPEMPKNVLEQLALLESQDAFSKLSAENLRILRDAALFYRSLDHAIRLVLGRSSSALPEPAQIPRVLALLRLWRVPLGHTAEVNVSDANLHNAVTSTRCLVRDIFNAVLTKSSA